MGNLGDKSGVAWVIPREIVPKKTAKGRDYLILKVIDTTCKLTTVKCWGYDPKKDVVYHNRPYMARLDYDDKWGYSMRNVAKGLRLLG